MKNLKTRDMKNLKTFHGEPCAKCTGTLRYLSTRNCVPCQRKKSRERKARVAHEDQAFDLIGNIK